MQEKLLYLQVKSEPKAAKNREFEQVSKMAQKKQKRENLERTERTQERTELLIREMKTEKRLILLGT